MKHEFIKDIHYYMDGVRVVFTALYHIERGECCGNRCKHCPYTPKHKKESVELAEEFIKFKDKIENGNG
jgi:2-iminoacetate synthase ThiH